MKRAALIAATGICVLGASLGVRLHGHASTPSCQLPDSTLLLGSDLAPQGRFEQILNGWQTAPPIKGTLAPRPAITDAINGRVAGYLNEVAISGPDRRAEDAYSESLGYDVGHLPLVPLVGSVVADNAGLLELYENVWLFKSRAGAEDMLAVLRGSGLADMVTEPVSFRLGDESFGYAMSAADHDPQTEHWVHLTVRVGDAVISVTGQGGAQLSMGLVENLTRRAVERFRSTCSG